MHRLNAYVPKKLPILLLAVVMLCPAAGVAAKVDLSSVWSGIEKSFLGPTKSKRYGPISLTMLAEGPLRPGSDLLLVCTLEAYDFPSPVKGVKLILGGEIVDELNGTTLQVLGKRSTKTKADGVATLEFPLEDHENFYVVLEGRLKKKRPDQVNLTCTLAPVAETTSQLGFAASRLRSRAKPQLAARAESATLRITGGLFTTRSRPIEARKFPALRIAGWMEPGATNPFDSLSSDPPALALDATDPLHFCKTHVMNRKDQGVGGLDMGTQIDVSRENISVDLERDLAKRGEITGEYLFGLGILGRPVDGNRALGVFAWLLAPPPSAADRSPAKTGGSAAKKIKSTMTQCERVTYD